ncbi:hypothetical protein E4T42_07732 [Aureobasidium subglaciale]|nr:hypothetical protein E4T42_07732 [Aureobasidium subglaciale]
MSISTEVPGKARSIISGLISGVFGIAAGASPLIGGAIVSNTTWRWVFLLNPSVPLCAVLIIITFLVFPKNLAKLELNRKTLGQVDWMGTLLYLITVVCLNFSLTEGGTRFSWRSAATIVPLIISGLSLAAFVAWEARLTALGARSQTLPLWPTRLFRTRAAACAMLTAFLSGVPLYSSYIYLPQRFELVNSLSPVQAGLRILILAWFAFIATGLSAAICNHRNLSFPILAASMALQSLSIGLISALPNTRQFPPQLYAYLIMLGTGFGLALPTVSMIARLEVSHLDHAVSAAAISSLRSLGGTIGISIGNIILSNQVWSKLAKELSKEQISQIRDSHFSLTTLTSEQITKVRATFGTGFDRNTRITMYFGIAAFVFSIGCFVRNPLEIRQLDEKEDAEKRQLDREIAAQEDLSSQTSEVVTPSINSRQEV